MGCGLARKVASSGGRGGNDNIDVCDTYLHEMKSAALPEEQKLRLCTTAYYPTRGDIATGAC